MLGLYRLNFIIKFNNSISTVFISYPAVSECDIKGKRYSLLYGQEPHSE